jgi:hypothetical protein
MLRPVRASELLGYSQAMNVMIQPRANVSIASSRRKVVLHMSLDNRLN